MLPFHTTSTMAVPSGSTVSSARPTMAAVGMGTFASGRGQTCRRPASLSSRTVRATSSHCAT
ncbi:MAG: hypothetical protein M5U28_06870 [Sandaracinaceae bacterium]|nr:hypothetical protein [Sandaracinaceae bacterium]